MYIKEDEPGLTGIKQIFFFDPDGNVIEISDCNPKLGDIVCSRDDKLSETELARDGALKKLIACGLTQIEITALLEEHIKG